MLLSAQKVLCMGSQCSSDGALRVARGLSVAVGSKYSRGLHVEGALNVAEVLV